MTQLQQSGQFIDVVSGSRTVTAFSLASRTYETQRFPSLSETLSCHNILIVQQNITGYLVLKYLKEPNSRCQYCMLKHTQNVLWGQIFSMGVCK